MSATTGGVGGGATSYVVVGNSAGTSVGGRPCNNHVVVGATNTSPFAGDLRGGPGTSIEQYVF